MQVLVLILAIIALVACIFFFSVRGLPQGDMSTAVPLAACPGGSEVHAVSTSFIF